MQSPLHSAMRSLSGPIVSCSAKAPKTGSPFETREASRASGDTRGLVGAMTLALKNTQIEPVPTAGTSAVTSLSAQQDRQCTSPTSFSEAEAVRSCPAPPAVCCTRDPIPTPCPLQVVFQLRPDAPEFVPLVAPASRTDAPEIAPSATRSAPEAEPNEADLLPALDSGREKLLLSTEVESTLKDWPTQEQASLKEQMARSNPCRHSTTASFVADASNQSSLQFPIPRMQVRAFEMKMATRWSDADDEDTALPRIPWQTAAGSAWPCIFTCLATCPHLRISLMLCVLLPELLSKYRSESVLVLQAASRALASRCRS